ncbi:MAG: hypothetical protein HYY16_15720 [Planctomycetes bacterium]|nr:hypothetical protein [Planctomycetota bacterium]
MTRFVIAALAIIALACGGGGGGSGGSGGDGGGGGVVAWTRYTGNPVLNPGPGGTWDSLNVASPCVRRAGASSWQMWYDGTADGTLWRIGYATSLDGVTWTKRATPVLAPGPAGSWDSEAVGMTAVTFDGTTYRLWYFGQSAAGASQIGLATSPDGVTWTKSASNPVLTAGLAGSWDSGGVNDPTVLYEGGAYKMWYAGGNAGGMAIGFATSADGVVWAKYAGNPVLPAGPPGSWDADGPRSPAVAFDGTTYLMWYGGNQGPNERIGTATSTNGATWTKYAGNPVLGPGAAGSWEENDVYSPFVVLDGSTTRMWYMADTNGGVSRIGYASKP